MEKLRLQTIQAVLAELGGQGKAPTFVEASVLFTQNRPDLPSEMLIMKIEITEDGKRVVRQYVRFLKKI